MGDPVLAEVPTESLIEELLGRFDDAIFYARRSVTEDDEDAPPDAGWRCIRRSTGDVVACAGLAQFAATDAVSDGACGG